MGSLLPDVCFLKPVSKKMYILEWFIVSLVYTVLVKSFCRLAFLHFFTISSTALKKLLKLR